MISRADLIDRLINCRACFDSLYAEKRGIPLRPFGEYRRMAKRCIMQEIEMWTPKRTRKGKR